MRAKPATTWFLEVASGGPFDGELLKGGTFQEQLEIVFLFFFLLTQGGNFLGCTFRLSLHAEWFLLAMPSNVGHGNPEPERNPAKPC